MQELLGPGSERSHHHPQQQIYLHSNSSPLMLEDVMDSKALVSQPTVSQEVLGMFAQSLAPQVAILSQCVSEFSPVDGLIT